MIVEKKKIKIISLVIAIIISSLILKNIIQKHNSIDMSLEGAGGDGRQNLEIAYNIYKYGVVGHGAKFAKPSDWREPLNPLLTSFVFKVLNLKDSNFDCLINFTTKKCKNAYFLGKYLNVVFFILILTVSFLFLNKIKTNIIINLIAILFIASNNFYILNRYNSETLTTFLFTCLFIVLFFLLSKKQKNFYIILGAVIFGSLILTRFSYFYLVLSFLVIVIFSHILNKFVNLKKIRSYVLVFLTKKNFIIFLIITLSFPFFWMTRNFFEVGVFHLSSRGINPLMYTAERLTITDEEIKYGIWHYFPDSKIRDKYISKFNKDISLRFVEGCGYKNSWYCKFYGPDSVTKKKISIFNFNNLYAHKKPALEIIKENFDKLPAISLISFIRGSLGLLDIPNSKFVKIFYSFQLFLLFILIPILFFGKNIKVLILSLPLYFNFSLYSVVTLFEPRYTFVIIPYMTLFTVYFINLNIKRIKKK